MPTRSALALTASAFAVLPGAALAQEAFAEAYVLRAEARLLGGDIDAALEDIEAARTLDPENIDILVLRGRIVEARRLQ